MEREQRLRQSLWNSSIRTLKSSWETSIYNFHKFILCLTKALKGVGLLLVVTVPSNPARARTPNFQEHYPDDPHVQRSCGSTS